MLTFVAPILLGQEKSKPPFWDDVQKFRVADQTNPPEKGQILFIGSSSFTRWTDVGTYFPDRKILNRAFGGSSLLDMIRYRRDLVNPYRPKQIVMYCGENDLAGDPKCDGYDVYKRFRTFFRAVRRDQPGVPFVYVSMKPSPSRMHLFAKQTEGNRLIKAYLRKWKHTAYVDVVPLMMNPDGQPKPEIFVEDKLHMNAQGYIIWKTGVEPVLLK